MTTVRTVATHDVTQAVHPRPETPESQVGKAVGIAIDRALAEYSHAFARRLRPARSAMERLAADVLEEKLEESGVELAASERERLTGQILAVVRSFRKSEVFGLSRPRSRLILIGEEAGVYAQPDYWDGRSKFYEMKSYRTVPTPPDVVLQLRLFQLAFPDCAGHLASFDRHVDPAIATIERLEPLPPSVSEETLRTARRVALAHGVDKVLEYVDVPVVRYPRPPE